MIITIQGSIGRVAITQYDAYVDRTLLLFESLSEKLDKKYFAYSLHLLFDIEKTKAPGGIIKTITIAVLNKFTIKIPSISEQQKIASVLSSLDAIISNQEEKIVQLENHKKGLLQRIFPKID